ncbi:hypothetical protein [Cryptosporangium aurantiacum]|uniref:Uncharacterized protein n=1 Tax=Cryptosporangium aurantiacum TaxID=134849 RepID=A0A1M7RL61_9ACTN|nr:hypothetical protein [Cryptosporangium aurantiacum]SHN47004.1 hypothetical protein SAMN05443668_119100 [Cryptosporangium aurantiacum]
MRVLQAFAWVVVYLVVAPITPLLLAACVVSGRPPKSRVGVQFSRRQGLLLLAGFYCWFIAPFLLGVAAVTVVATAVVPWFRSLSPPGLAGVACVVAVIVVFIGWAIHYPDQRRRMFR